MLCRICGQPVLSQEGATAVVQQVMFYETVCGHHAAGMIEPGTVLTIPRYMLSDKAVVVLHLLDGDPSPPLYAR